MSRRSIVIYGPQRCGKTRYVQALQDFFALPNVIDDWDGHTRYPNLDTLVLTNNPDAIAEPDSRTLHFGAAMREMRAAGRFLEVGQA